MSFDSITQTFIHLKLLNLGMPVTESFTQVDIPVGFIILF